MTLLAVGYLGVQYMLALGRVAFLPALGVVAVAEIALLGAIGIEVAADVRGDRAGPAGRGGAVGAGDRARAGPPRGGRALSDAPRDRGLAHRRRRPRGCAAAALACAAGGRGRRDRLLPRALDGRAGARPPARWSRSTRTPGSDRGPQEIAAEASRGDADHAAFLANLAAAGVARPRAARAQVLRRDAHGDVDGPLSLLYVDGAHRFGPARADLRDWGGRVAPGGTMLVHDSFSSIGVTLALLRRVRRVAARGATSGRTGSLAEYSRRSAVAVGARGPWISAATWSSCRGSRATWRSRCWCWRGGARWAERIGLDPAAPWPY